MDFFDILLVKKLLSKISSGEDAGPEIQEIIKQLEDTYDLIVCSGGDGTLNELVSGMLDARRNEVIGYIPSGSANDFGRSLGITTDVEKALKITVDGVPTDIDVGCFNQNYFVYVAAFGTLAQVSYSTPQKLKNSFGYLAYILQGIKAFSELKSYELKLEYDNGYVEGSFFVGMITNSFSVGGFKNPACSLTSLNDGIFEVLLVRMPKSVMELQSIITALLNENVESEYLVFLQTTKISVTSEPIEWTFDGEEGGQFKEGDISIIPKAIKVIT